MSADTPIDANFKDQAVVTVTGTLSGVERYSTKPDRPADGRIWASGRLAHSLGDITVVFTADLLDADPHLVALLNRGEPVGMDVTARLETWGDPLGPELRPPNTAQLFARAVTRSRAQIAMDVAGVEKIVRDAVASRVGYDYGSYVLAVRASEQHPQAVLVAVNSGGNASAAEDALTARGYTVTSAPGTGYGVNLLVAMPGAPGC